MLITISGTPGSGKTTVARLLSKRLELPHIYAGDLYRAEADRRGLPLPEFNRLTERDHSIDREIDQRLAAHARAGSVVLEGRLAGFICHQEGLNALKVWLTASDETRARRVASRENGNWKELLEGNRKRHESDARRYHAIYGFDLADTSIYDLVLHSDDSSPEALAEVIVAEVRRLFGSASCKPRTSEPSGSDSEEG